MTFWAIDLLQFVCSKNMMALVTSIFNQLHFRLPKYSLMQTVYKFFKKSRDHSEENERMCGKSGRIAGLPNQVQI